MNYDLAAKEMMEKSSSADTPVIKAEQDPTGLTLNHAYWMLLQIRVNGSWSDSKKGRWLGWAQAVFCFHQIFELDEMKALNRACLCDDEGCPQYGRTHIHKDKPAIPADHTGRRDSHT